MDDPCSLTLTYQWNIHWCWVYAVHHQVHQLFSLSSTVHLKLCSASACGRSVLLQERKHTQIDWNKRSSAQNQAGQVLTGIVMLRHQSAKISIKICVGDCTDIRHKLWKEWYEWNDSTVPVLFTWEGDWQAQQHFHLHTNSNVNCSDSCNTFCFICNLPQLSLSTFQICYWVVPSGITFVTNSELCWGFTTLIINWTMSFYFTNN